jgi:ketosteroid isomerase-like protein
MNRNRILTIILSLLLISYCSYAQQDTVNAGIQAIHPAGNQQENIKIASVYFECLFKTRDFTLMGKIIAKDAVYDQAEGLPYGGTYIGLQEWIKMYTKAQSFFDLQIEGEPEYFASTAGDQVIIYFRIRCKSKNSGKTISMPVAEYFKIKDKQIVNIRPFYFDTNKFTEFLQ